MDNTSGGTVLPPHSSAQLFTKPGRTRALNFDNVPTEEQWMTVAAFRQRIVDEDNLISARVGWQIGLQTVLFALWAAFLATQNEPMLAAKTAWFFEWPHKALFLTGAVAAAFGILNIWAAHIEIKKALRDYRDQYPELYNDHGVPKMTGNDFSHAAGHVVPLLVPSIFLFLQGTLLVLP
jgi:hypothetical protein